jgi:succinylarginine dihydrolase
MIICHEERAQARLKKKLHRRHVFHVLSALPQVCMAGEEGGWLDARLGAALGARIVFTRRDCCICCDVRWR